MQTNHNQSSPEKKDNPFRDFCCSPDGQQGMAIERGPYGITVHALRKTLDEFNPVATSILSGIPVDAKPIFKFGDYFGEVFFPDSLYGARYDFSSGRMLHVHRNLWINSSGVESDPTMLKSLPETPLKIDETFFPVRKSLFAKKTWKNFIIRDPDDDWAGYDDRRSDAAILLLIIGQEFILNACLKKHTPLIISSIQLPVSFKFPLEFKIGFRENIGAFVLNDGEFICMYDFQSFTGEAILPQK